MKSVIKILCKISGFVVTLALLVVLGVCAAAIAKDSTFSVEFANMVAWFASWAK